MSKRALYQFHIMQQADTGLFNRWRAQPHVLEWWGEDDEEDEEAIASPLVKRWIVRLNGRPFAYIQDYAVHGWPFDHHFAHLPEGSRGIDQFIGEPDLLGQGHGRAFIAAHVANLFNSGAPVVATDPDPENTRAIAVFERIGFSAYADPFDSDWGRILPMKVTK
ncbi:GNAT family N-acetyltransferase [Cognatishimia activa]|uniref:Aminoglycoside N(6')-acetyltransferase type 1 n=1 Tax=Cognatishimia activa TaxID=1715691 RepID=A0A0P1JAS4_9RHOB|nr:GNAT family N-acetyltransferase [Cognatishimia activa]CUJ37282.1 Aminoglycoside N(6')-acetyltransferase type 1 [Cognatishimia activa]CUK26972.1 Aminoglycoside N(6')-acetyltransferase type 1 [Cognatishimia activa]